MIFPVRRGLPALITVGLLQFTAFFALAHIAVAWVPAGRTAVLKPISADLFHDVDRTGGQPSATHAHRQQQGDQPTNAGQP